MGIKFLYFDMGNVLLRFSHQRAALQMADVAGCSEKVVWDVVFGGRLEWEYESGKIDGRGFYRQFCQATSTEPDFSQLEQAGCDIFEPEEPILPLLLELKAAGWRLGVFSNTNEAHWRWVSQRFPALFALFDLFALSYQLGDMKPSPAAFERAARLAACSASELFFTDDRRENVDAALACGWMAVQFDSASHLRLAMRKAGLTSS